MNAFAVIAYVTTQYDRPASVLTDNVKAFTSNIEPLHHNKPIEFEEQLMKNHIKHVHSRSLPSVNKQQDWKVFVTSLSVRLFISNQLMICSRVQPHQTIGCMDLNNMEISSNAYYAKNITNEVLTDSSILWEMNHESVTK